MCTQPRIVCDCFLSVSDSDADAFFLMCTGSEYREKLKISADRFVAALVRVFEKMASSRHIQQAHACNTLIRDHITPHAVEKYGHLLDPHAHAVAYGYDGPLAGAPRRGEQVQGRTAAPMTPYARTHGGVRNHRDARENHAQQVKQNQVPGFGGSRRFQK